MSQSSQATCVRKGGTGPDGNLWPSPGWDETQCSFQISGLCPDPRSHHSYQCVGETGDPDVYRINNGSKHRLDMHGHCNHTGEATCLSDAISMCSHDHPTAVPQAKVLCEAPGFTDADASLVKQTPKMCYCGAVSSWSHSLVSCTSAGFSRSCAMLRSSGRSPAESASTHYFMVGCHAWPGAWW